MSNDPVIHDQHLNQSFRSDIPKKPEPEMEGVRISWAKVVPKYTDILGVQITHENFDHVARLNGFDSVEGDGFGRRYLIVPTPTGDVRAFVDDWLLVADNNWDQITVCSSAAFTRNYEVRT